MDKHFFTVFTPTFNRKELLQRVYENLKAQTFKDFEWLIIDDGSTDGTQQLVEEWKKEDCIDIHYHWKENGGKHNAFKKAYELCNTDYIIDFDDDDIYLPTCLELFHKEWERIEKEKADHIGSIKFLTQFENGDIVGDDSNIKDGRTIDTNYIDFQFKGKRPLENVTSTRMAAYKESPYFYFDDQWHGRRIRFVYENVFWARFAKKFDTRYVFTPVRIYNSNSIGITRGRKDHSAKWVSNAYSTMLFFKENKTDISIWQYQNFRSYIIYLTQVLSLKLPYITCAKELGRKDLTIFACVLYPLIFVFSLYLKNIRHQYSI